MDKSKLYKFPAICERVVDGDTLRVRIDKGFHDWGIEELRLLNVDTPERGQINYKEATEFVKARIEGKEIIVQTFKDDRFGRYLAVVWYGEDETMLNDEILNSGLIKPNSKWNK